MKVIHIISNKVWGGGEQYVYDLARRLVSDGHEVELVARQIPSVWDKLKSLNVPLTPLTFNNLLKMQADVVHVHNFKDARKVAWARMLSGKKMEARRDATSGSSGKKRRIGQMALQKNRQARLRLGIGAENLLLFQSPHGQKQDGGHFEQHLSPSRR